VEAQLNQDESCASWGKKNIFGKKKKKDAAGRLQGCRDL
jgi:hypothetical protein